ncbi:MAG: NAD(+) synthase [Clostridiales bacterium]|nr:NAD(+) synthase [Clostridiales bacterium]
MKHGFIRCAAGTLEVAVADCQKNADRIIELIDSAGEEGVRFLVLPELCITGYTCGELFIQQSLLDAATAGLKRVVKATVGKQMIVIVGVPLSSFGKLYNCAAVIYEGEILGVVPKSNIPNYGEFYEARYFSPAPSNNTTVAIDGEQYPFGPKLVFVCEDMPQFTFAVEICEDLWVANSPSISHSAAGALIIGNLSAGNEVVGKEEYRRLLVSNQSAKLVCGYVYSGAGTGESTTDLVFSGHRIVAENGDVLEDSGLFSLGLTTTEIDVLRLDSERRRMRSISHAESDISAYQKIMFSMPLSETELTRRFERNPFVSDDAHELRRRCRTILSIQAHGLRKRLEHTGARFVIIGVSGGLDSTLALIACAEAMDLMGRPRSDIMAITMPGFGTTNRTRKNAEYLAEQVGAMFRTIPINDAVTQHFNDISHDPSDHDVVYENAQARERTQVLMDLANKHGGLMVGPGDLSETALGFTTYNGDHMSMYSINSSVPKTMVRHIVKYYADYTDNDVLRKVLLNILDTPVSPELLPPEDGEITQRTESIVGPYELHDFFLYYSIRLAFPPSKVYRLAVHVFEGDYSKKEIYDRLCEFYRRFFGSQYKRSCAPDGPKVGSLGLSPRTVWRMPSDAMPTEWIRELEACRLPVD